VQPSPTLLQADLDRLGAALTQATRELSGAHLAALVHALRDDAIALRAGQLPGGRAALAARIAGLGLDDLEDVARVFTHWCHLLNTAEEQQRIRVLRARDRADDGVAAAVLALRDAGLTADDVAALFARALVMPVLSGPGSCRRSSAGAPGSAAIATATPTSPPPSPGPRSSASAARR
jgi:phosphoenolpyruvate carboxylase